MSTRAEHGGPPGEDLSVELVRRIQAGDRDAWDGLYLRYHDALLFTVRARMGGKLRGLLQSEDILQSVVKDALSDLERFEPRGPGSLAHYLHVCVLNKIRSKAEYHGAARRAGTAQSSTTALDEIARAPEAEPQYFDSERFGRLERALSILPESMREVLVLRTAEGLSNQEAASILGSSPEATSKLYNRALARMAATLPPGARP